MTCTSDHRWNPPGPLVCGTPQCGRLNIIGHDLVGAWQIGRALGKGGFGQVHVIHHHQLGEYAVKVMPAEVVLSDPDARRRFDVEIAALKTLDGVAGCVYVEDAGWSDALQAHWFRMRKAVGKSLFAMLQQGQLAVEQAISIASQVCTTLAAAHARQVVHRDISTGNVMVDGSGRTTLIDFGMAQLLQNANPGGPLIGTPGYIAPELYRNEAPSQASDQFALGVLLFRALTRKYPFAIDHRFLEQVQMGKLWLTSTRPDVPPRLEDAVARALRFDPADRFESMTAFQVAIDSCRVVDVVVHNDDAELHHPTAVALGTTLGELRDIALRDGQRKLDVPLTGKDFKHTFAYGLMAIEEDRTTLLEVCSMFGIPLDAAGPLQLNLRARPPREYRD